MDPVHDPCYRIFLSFHAENGADGAMSAHSSRFALTLSKLFSTAASGTSTVVVYSANTHILPGLVRALMPRPDDMPTTSSIGTSITCG